MRHRVSMTVAARTLAAAGSSLRLQIVALVVAPKASTISDTVKVTGNTFDPDLQDNQVTVFTTVQ